MSVRRNLVAAVAGVLCASIACDDGPTAPGGTLPFSSVHSEAFSGITTSRTEIIRDEQRWAAVWSEISARLTPEPPRPMVDFSREMLVLVGIGERPDGCFAVEILALSSTGGRIEVRAAEQHRQGPACACLAATTQPVQVVRTLRTDGSADPRIESRIVSCP